MTDYFDFFNIPRAFNLDQQELRRKYISNSKASHPDFFTLENKDKQDAVLRMSTLNNEGYNILSDHRRLVQHILQLEGMMPEEGKAQVPGDFLIQMMDINERLMEAQMDPAAQGLQAIFNDLDQLEEELAHTAQCAKDQWDEDHSGSSLETVRDIFLKQQYLRRLRQQIKSGGSQL